MHTHTPVTHPAAKTRARSGNKPKPKPAKLSKTPANPRHAKRKVENICIDDPYPVKKRSEGPTESPARVNTSVAPANSQPHTDVAPVISNPPIPVAPSLSNAQTWLRLQLNKHSIEQLRHQNLMNELHAYEERERIRRMLDDQMMQTLQNEQLLLESTQFGRL